jgi:predicted TIM-barrel fold metal-dependent hydrolase
MDPGEEAARIDERLVVISSDSHAGADLYGYKPYLEKRWHEEFEEWAKAYSNPWRFVDERPDSVTKTGAASGELSLNWDSDRRVKDLAYEGIVAEVVFPNTPTPFVPDSTLSAPVPKTREEYERRWAGLQAHNRWLVDFCSEVPGRRAGVAEILLYDVDDAVAEVRATREAGLTGGIVLPVDGHENGLVPLYYTDYEPLWGVCEELGVPVHRHARAPGGPVSKRTGPGGFAIGLLELQFWDHRALSHVIFSGVLQRHPGLTFVMTETGVGWIPQELARMDALWAESKKSNGRLAFLVDALAELSMSPTEYFRRNCYVGASLLTTTEMEKRHVVGVDRLMWGQDYPHSEGTFPFSRTAYQMLFGDAPEDQIRSMLSETAAKVYGFDLDHLQVFANESGPTLAELRAPITEYPAVPQETISPVFRGGESLAALGR